MELKHQRIVWVEVRSRENLLRDESGEGKVGVGGRFLWCWGRGLDGSDVLRRRGHF